MLGPALQEVLDTPAEAKDRDTHAEAQEGQAPLLWP